jgi:hypothetical protein
MTSARFPAAVPLSANVKVSPRGHARMTSGVGRKAAEIGCEVRFPPETYRRGGLAGTGNVSYKAT